MSAAVGTTLSHHTAHLGAPRATRDPAWVRWTLTSIALLFLACFLVLPLAAVFVEAFRRGAGAYFASFVDSDARSSIKLT